ncbi:MAG TPA: triphosphoribosyl-dephospho-CoA synthase [Candidatus Lokiarchaeia archaeon]|nr:triphosphoribosyl-dephospho-CoA synthase [Candidatus Lokiarchaeia archaeon]
MNNFSTISVENAHNVASCATLAALLEVSAYPKPGNVHRTRDFEDTKYEHFLAAAVAIYPALFRAAQAPIEDLYPESQPDLLGTVILEATRHTQEWQSGGNVNFGEILLFSPIAIAAGLCIKAGERELDQFRIQVSDVVHRATIQDAAFTYQAFQAAPVGNLGSRERFDVMNPDAVNEILADKMTFWDCFMLNPDTDDISAELTGNYARTFGEGLPHLAFELDEGAQSNAAIVNTFLYLLGNKPDSFIARKVGLERAQEVQKKAQETFAQGGMKSEEGIADVNALDEELQKAGGKLNPGTTADILGATLFVACLCGFRP